MGKVIAKRFIFMIPVVLAVTFIIFMLSFISAGDAARVLAEQKYEHPSPEQVEEVRHDGIVNAHSRVAQHGSFRLLSEDATEKHDPRGNGNDQAHRRRRGVDDVAQHLTRRFLFIGNRQNSVRRNQNGQVIVDEDDHAAQPREEQRLALAFDVFTRPVRHGRTAGR